MFTPLAPNETRLVRGEALAVLQTIPARTFHTIATDPPYSSGGMFRDDRVRSTGEKYLQSGTKKKAPDFAGDSRDQLAYLTWCTLWLAQCYRVAEPGGYCLIFTDWRQLATTINALQCGGFVYRGVVPWDKGNGARAPHTGYFRHQCEYVVWGSKGKLPRADGRGPFPGVFRHTIRPSLKLHQTGKPEELMVDLLRCARPGSAVLDSFGGSGTTLAAARTLGLRALAIEVEDAIADIAAARLGVAS